MPDPRSVVRAVKSAAKQTLKWGATQAPWAADGARRAYFDAANRRVTQEAAYREWLERHTVVGVSLAERRLQARAWTHQRLVTVVLDVAGFDPAAQRLAFLALCRQAFEQWEVVVVSDGPVDVRILRDDHQVVCTVAVQGCRADRFNAGLAAAHGDWVVLLTCDDALYDDTLYELVAALEATANSDLAYGGEDVAAPSREGDRWTARDEDFFKPDWNPELLRSMPYLGTAVLMRTSLVRAVGGVRDLPGAEWWDLQLRVTTRTRAVAAATGVIAGRRRGCPVLVADSVARTVLTDAAIAEGRPDAVISQGEGQVWHTRYPVVGEPLVSIVIPSRNAYEVVRRCVESVLALTSYERYEIVLVDTGSDDPRVHDWYGQVAARDARFRVVDWGKQPFSYSEACNDGAAAAQGSILVMLNNDTEVLAGDWLAVLVGEAERPEVGAVGCLLLYPDRRTIQHAGIGLGIKGVAGNSLAGLRQDQWLSRTQRAMRDARHQATAVTAACLAIRADLYREVGGFDPELRITFNDVDLCCRLHAAGLRNVYTPQVRLLHHESISVSTLVAGRRDWTEFRAAVDQFTQRWHHLLRKDPHMNPHLSKGTTSYRLTYKGR